MKFVVVCALLIVMVITASFTSSVAQPQRAQKTDETLILFGGTGNDLLERCSHPAVRAGETMQITELIKTAKDNGMCLGYIVGVSDQAMGEQTSAHGKRNYCLPSEVRSEQLVMVVKKYLEDNPAQLHYEAEVLTIHALSDAFPCQ
ncbi:MAG TPA: Rap1a/Tai family immunity protein [Candidatus Sulfotelmatobacter sp.]|nr:Rap1a/Tai family immunity protein [Candidatus Sulfotelmatobacter sp.]